MDLMFWKKQKIIYLMCYGLLWDQAKFRWTDEIPDLFNFSSVND